MSITDDTTELASDLRHDLKSPLAGMKALIYTARKRLGTQEYTQVEEALTSLDNRIDTLVGEINRFSELVEAALKRKDR